MCPLSTSLILSVSMPSHSHHTDLFFFFSIHQMGQIYSGSRAFVRAAPFTFNTFVPNLHMFHLAFLIPPPTIYHYSYFLICLYVSLFIHIGTPREKKSFLSCSLSPCLAPVDVWHIVGTQLLFVE